MEIINKIKYLFKQPDINMYFYINKIKERKRRKGEERGNTDV